MARTDKPDQRSAVLPGEWHAPELKHIGSIADVAGRPVPVRQDSGNRKS